jgi:uncharacterized protein
MSTTIYIDADACPVTSEALAVARSLHVPVIIAGNSTQNLERHIRRSDPRRPEDASDSRSVSGSHHTFDSDAERCEGFWVDTLMVGIGADSADFAIVEQLQPCDVVITQDIGLASMVLGRGARAIGVRGRIYNPITIDMDMQIRHAEKKIRRQGGRTKGPAAFTDDDRECFIRNLRRLVEEAR